MNAGGCWPTSRQELLLKAALCDGESARNAYAVWCALTELDAPDAGTFRLLPLLFRNLKPLAVKDDRQAMLHGIYRRSWAKNQLLFREVGAALVQLAAAGISTLIVKGAALSVAYYRDLGARPMSDADVLVPVAQAQQAAALLVAAGWTSKETPLEGQRAERLLQRLGVTVRPREVAQCSSVFVGVRHGHSFEKPGLAEIDLHWRLDERVRAAADGERDDAALWQRAVPITIAGVKTRTLEPTDQLLQVIAHGVRWNVVPPWRWVADAAMILRQPDAPIDWSRLVEDAVRRGVAPSIRDGLAYLSRLLALPVPPAIVAQLGARSTSLAVRAEYALRTRPAGVVAGLHELSYLLRRYRAMAGRPDYPHAAHGPLHFLQHVLGIDHLWQVGVYSAVEVLRRGHSAWVHR
jgi:hypothetical protein